jgi:hypothetical protein
MEENQASEEIAEQEPAQNSGEKMLAQSEVNTLVGRTRAEAQERGRKQAEAEYQQKLAEVQKSNYPGEKPEIDADMMYQQVQERFNQEMQQRSLENEMRQVADNYSTKMSQGADKYEDFGDVMKDFDPAAFPQLVYLVANMDNASDIMYELSKNGSKLASVDHLSKISPAQAKKELARIGQSITANREAMEESQQQGTDAPLDRMQSSRISGNNGQMSIRDYRNQPWLKV